jgi:CRISPR-associated protein Csd2
MQKTTVKRRVIVIVIEVINCNPNGDPDLDGQPRQLPSGLGLISAECTKRKIRNAVALLMRDDEGNPAVGYDLAVKRGVILEQHVFEAAYREAGVQLKDKTTTNAQGVEVKVKGKDRGPSTTAEKSAGNRQVLAKFFDARWFGMVGVGVGAGSRLTGPLQVNPAESVLPIEIVQVGITRQATGNESQSEAQKGLNQNQGRRYMVPHALYTQVIFLDPFRGDEVGFTEADYQVFESALKVMYEFDRSSGRGFQTLQQAVVFEFEHPIGGGVRAYDLVKRVQVKPKTENPASYTDYEVSVVTDGLPSEITMHTLYPLDTPQVAETAKPNGAPRDQSSTIA